MLVHRILDAFFRALDAVDATRERIDRMIGRETRPDPWAQDWKPVPEARHNDALPTDSALRRDDVTSPASASKSAKPKAPPKRPAAKPAAAKSAPAAKPIAKGAPADLILVDLTAPRLIDADQLLSKSKNSAFDGRRLQGRVLRTLVDGRTVFEAS